MNDAYVQLTNNTCILPTRKKKFNEQVRKRYVFGDWMKSRKEENEEFVVIEWKRTIEW